MKKLTRDQVSARKAAAVRFLETVKGDPDRADEVADESIEHYAQRRRFEIRDNPQRSNPMAKTNAATATKQDLLDRISELEDENADLSDQLSAIADIANGDDEGDDDGDDSDDQD